MRWRRVIYSLIVLLAIINIAVLTGCSDNVGNDKDNSMKVTLNAEEIVITTSEVQPIIAKSADSSNRITYQSDNIEVASVNEMGVVTAIKAGKANITAGIEGGGMATCVVRVADSIVSSGFNSMTPNYGNTRYRDISSAVAKGGKVIVLSGDYPEDIVAKGDVDIEGVGNVKLRSISGGKVTVSNITFLMQSFPMVNTAAVRANTVLKVTECSFVVSENSVEPIDFVGGYAVLMDGGAQEIEVVDSSFVNFRMAIYLHHTAARIKIVNNRFLRCQTAIEVNLRGDGNMLGDYEASGEIASNLYFDCLSNTEFIYSGSSYRGKLDYQLVT